MSYKLDKSKIHDLITLEGFTLVELIVVIVVLTILATIAFISFSNYSSWSRDSKRMSNINLIAKWFEMNIAGWKSINIYWTSTSPNIILSWGTITYSWYYNLPIKQSLLKSLWIFWWDIDNITIDSFASYRSTYIPSFQKYQVMWLLENRFNKWWFSYYNKTVLEDIFASSWSGYAFIKWNYVATWWINWLIPKQDIWEITPYTWSWKIINWVDTISNWDTANTINIESPAQSPLPNSCTIDDTWTWWKIDYCIFGL